MSTDRAVRALRRIGRRLPDLLASFDAEAAGSIKQAEWRAAMQSLASNGLISLRAKADADTLFSQLAANGDDGVGQLGYADLPERLDRVWGAKAASDAARLRARLRPYPFLVVHPRAPGGRDRDPPTWFRDPNVDVFVACESQAGTTITFVDENFLPTHTMPRRALFPLRQLRFGELSVNVPAEPETVLDAAYGESWRREASLATRRPPRLAG